MTYYYTVFLIDKSVSLKEIVFWDQGFHDESQTEFVYTVP